MRIGPPRNPKSQFPRARRLRRDQTDAERTLWVALRSRRFAGLKFKRQAPIGRCIADFCSFEARLVIELDGGQHAENAEADAERTRWLQSQGFTVLRFWNADIFRDVNAVLEAIYQATALPPSP